MNAIYILFGYEVALILVLIGFTVVRRTVPELRGMRRLSFYVLTAAFAVVLLAARNRAPALLTLFLSNALLLFSPLFFYTAAAEILDVRARGLRWLAALSVAGTGALYWFSLVQPRVRIRLVAHGIVVGVIFAAAAALLFRNRDAALGTAARAAAWFAAVIAALQFAWLCSPFVLRAMPSFQHPDIIDAGFSYLAMMLALAAVAALVWLSLCAHRRKLELSAQTDSLTGLLNRGAFEAVLFRDLQRCHRSGTTLGVMLIDLDYFKLVNDSFGHAVGDHVLRRISAALRAGTRSCDVLARYGGEEFVILLRGAGVEESQSAAERIRSAIAVQDEMPEGVSLTASIGVAVNLPGESPEALLQRADEALYRSKREGRNLVTLHRSPRRGTLIRM